MWSVANICLELCVFWQVWSILIDAAGCEIRGNGTVSRKKKNKIKCCPWPHVPRPLLHLSVPSCHCSNLFLTPRVQALMLIHISPAVAHEQQRMQGTIYHLCLIQPLPDRGHDTVGVYPPHIYFCFSISAVQVSAPRSTHSANNMSKDTEPPQRDE